MKVYLIGLVMFVLIGALLTKMYGFNGKASATGAVIGVALMCLVLLWQARTHISIPRCVLTALTSWIIVYDIVSMMKPSDGSKAKEKRARAAETETAQTETEKTETELEEE
ncbi:MAG: hypothetical protein IJU59_06720 [Firmicutes bacterium]|nr:hypothetical protein [Bacillota bacterium]